MATLKLSTYKGNNNQTLKLSTYKGGNEGLEIEREAGQGGGNTAQNNQTLKLSTYKGNDGFEEQDKQRRRLATMGLNSRTPPKDVITSPSPKGMSGGGLARAGYAAKGVATTTAATPAVMFETWFQSLKNDLNIKDNKVLKNAYKSRDSADYEAQMAKMKYGQNSPQAKAAQEEALYLGKGANILSTGFDGEKEETKRAKAALAKELTKANVKYNGYVSAYGEESEQAKKAKREVENIFYAIDGLKLNQGVDMDSFGQKLMAKGIETTGKATEGMTGGGKLLADTAISVAENAALLPLAAIHPSAPLAAMTAKAGARKMYELNERGIGANEALTRGIVSGVIEGATEKLPLDNLLDMVKSGGKGVLKNILKQSGIEATEEALSYTLNYIADKASKDEDATFDVRELLLSAAAGGLSGGFFGVAGSGFNKVMNRGGNNLNSTQQKNAELTKAEINKKALASVGLNEDGNIMKEFFEGANTQAEKNKKALASVGLNEDGNIMKEFAEGKRIENEEKIKGSLEILGIKDDVGHPAVKPNNAVEVEGNNVENKPIEQIKREYLASTDNKILEFIQKVKTLKDKTVANKFGIKISNVSSREIADIKNAVGIDVSGYEHKIKGNAINHIIRRHGENGFADNTMKDDKDLARIKYVLDNYDRVEILKNKKGKNEISREFQNSDGSGAIMVNYSKRINGNYYVIEAVPDNKAKTMYVVSAYKSAKEKGAPQIVPIIEKNPTPYKTSETSLASTPNSSISNNTEKTIGNESIFESLNSEEKGTPQEVPIAEKNPTPYLTPKTSLASAPNSSIANNTENTTGNENIIDGRIEGEGQAEQVGIKSYKNYEIKKMRKQYKAEIKNKLANALFVPYSTKRGTLVPIFDELVSEIKYGDPRIETINNTFESLYKNGIEMVEEHYSKYNETADKLRKITFKSNDGYLKANTKVKNLLNFADDGVNVDIVYKKLAEMHPELFNENTTKKHLGSVVLTSEEKLLKINQVVESVVKAENRLDDFTGDDAEMYKALAEDRFLNELQYFENNIKNVIENPHKPQIAEKQKNKYIVKFVNKISNELGVPYAQTPDKLTHIFNKLMDEIENGNATNETIYNAFEIAYGGYDGEDANIYKTLDRESFIDEVNEFNKKMKNVDEIEKQEKIKGSLEILGIKDDDSVETVGIDKTKEALEILGIKYTDSAQMGDINGIIEEGVQAESGESADMGDVNATSNITANKNIFVSSKAERLQKQHVTRINNKLANDLGVPYNEKRDTLLPIFNKLTEEIKNGGATIETINNAFESAYKSGIIIADEYYNQYKELKNGLRKIVFKRDGGYIESMEGGKNNLRFADNGAKVDVVYNELIETYPELFNENITNTTDQLLRINEVVSGIVKTEVKLNDFLGEDAKMYKALAKDRFLDEVQYFEKNIKDIARLENDVIEQKAKRAELLEGSDNLTIDGIVEIATKASKLKKDVERVMSKEALTQMDKKMVDSLLNGTTTVEELYKKGGFNVDGILAAYDVKYKLKAELEPILRYRQQQKAKVEAEIAELIEGSDGWKDKIWGRFYSRETQERNIIDIAGEKNGQAIIDKIFTPVHENEAKSTKDKNYYRDRIRKLGISTKQNYIIKQSDLIELNDSTKTLESLIMQKGENEEKTFKVSESELVQLYGEGRISKEGLENAKVNVGKIEIAVDELKSIYRELLEMANIVLIRNGYDPVPFRESYFPHFALNQPDNIILKLGNKIGFNFKDLIELPTSIAGITYTFHPGKKYVANFNKRTGDITHYDAIMGFDMYIENIMDVVHHTDDIKRLRTFECALRSKYSEEGTKAEIDEIRNDPNKTDEEKTVLLDDIFKREITHLPKYVENIKNYTDGLAGKKNIKDRGMEQDFNRGVYDVMTNLENRVASNMVAGNLGSALTNLIVLAQGTSGISTSSMLKAMQETTGSYAQDDGFAFKSDFLVNRMGSEPLYLTSIQRASNVAALPMTLVDEFASNVIVRGRYMDNIKDGMDENSAMKDANDFAAKLIADRSKGALPTIFNEKNPLTKLVTMFQVEVNNQLSYLFKDLPRDKKNRKLAVLGMSLFRYFLSSYLFNNIYEWITGRRFALDPIGMATNAITGYKEDGAVESAKRIGTDIVEQIPFVGGVIGGGRLPISAALPNVGTLADEIGTWYNSEKGQKENKKALAGIGNELRKPAANLLLPFGGGQVNKTVSFLQDADVLNQRGYGASYTPSGRIRFPIEKTPENMIKGTLFGKYATKEGKEYVKSGFKSIDAAQSEKIDRVIKLLEVTPQEAIDFTNRMKKLESDKSSDGKIVSNSLANKKIDEIFKMTRDIKKRGELVKEYVISDEAADKVIALIDRGIDEKMIIDIYVKSRNVTGTTINGKKVSAKAQLEKYINVNYKDISQDNKKAVLDSFG